MAHTNAQTVDVFIEQFHADPDARELAMFFKRILLSKCEQLWAYIGRVSSGMRAEIDWVHQMDIPLRFFATDFQEVHPA